MTHASLSPDLAPATSLGRLEGKAGTTESAGPAASLWLLALTSLTLVFASLVLLGLLAQSSLVGGAVGGFATAIATVTGGLGVVVMGYVTLAAHRAGYLRAPQVERSTTETAVPEGLRVAPVVPAGLAYRRRQEQAAERAERRKQARAIDAAAMSRQAPTAPAPAHQAPAPSMPGTSAAQAPAPTHAAPVTAPTRPASVGQAVPARALASERATPRPALRAAAPPAYLRLDPPRVRPRAQATLLQVGAASVRAPFVPQQPHPVVPHVLPRP